MYVQGESAGSAGVDAQAEFLPPYTQQCKARGLPLLYRWGGGYQSGGSGHGGIRILPET